jgi:predicted short-subunit dehydrogenase-like oxidoreductase (DUF2520 family)
VRLGIVGGGRAAWAFGSALRAAGWTIGGIWLRAASTSSLSKLLSAPRAPIEDLARANDVILIAVSDAAIGEAFALIAPHLSRDAVLFHTSGAVTSEIFGAAVRGFSLHPFRALPPVGEPLDLRDTLLVFEGSADARPVAETITTAVGGRFAEITRQQKMLYHAGAVFGSNYVAALLETAQSLIETAGVSSASRKDLAELAFSAIDIWLRNRGAAGFTGPVARGDARVIARHLAELRDSPRRREIYRLLALEICEIVEREKPEIARVREALE